MPAALLLTCVLPLLASANAAPPPPAPILNIDPKGISCSGISSGADFAVQFATAFSAHVMGVGVFAGQPYHCAVTRFPSDTTFPCKLTLSSFHSPVGPAGCQGSAWDPRNSTELIPLPTEPAAPDGHGLLWDHCKGCTPESKAQLLAHPNLVQLDTLEAYARASASAGLIDGVGNLSGTRAFVFRGTKDSCYSHRVMEQTTEWFARFAANATEQMRFVDDVPSLHAIPTLQTGTKCGTQRHFNKYARGAMHGLEACGFDGPGEALQHIYGYSLQPPANASAIDAGSVLRFDQLPHGMLGEARRDMAFARDGYAYVPRGCAADAGGAPCRLHVFFHGCGSAFNSGATADGANGFNDTFIAHAGFSAWGEANRIVILFPQKDATMETCWDGYGWGGPEWATRRGGQMAAVWKLVTHVAGLSELGAKVGSDEVSV